MTQYSYTALDLAEKINYNGAKGSVRPDYYKVGHSVDIKNYNLESSSGRRNEEFTFLIIDCLEDDNSSNNIGLYTLWVVDSENEDSQLTAWQDMETPGIHIAIAK